eukprot:m.9429 g.9429  ORF g.9429 m.9429 type:complete len:210 (+) comp6349_c0_seq1:55-684(+)
MALVRVTNVDVLHNPAKFTDPLFFRVTFECMEPLHDDTEWKLVYVGSAESERYDQELDSVLVGPVNVGVNRFDFQVDAPDPAKIPPQELCGVTVVILTCSYKDQEFVRVGYYVNVDYANPELRDNPPPEPIVAELERSILDSKPRVTRFHIDWSGDGSGVEQPPEQQEVEDDDVMREEDDDDDAEEEEEGDEEEEDMYAHEEHVEQLVN